MLVQLAICMPNEAGKLALVVPGLCIRYSSTRSTADIMLLKSQHLFRKGGKTRYDINKTYGCHFFRNSMFVFGLPNSSALRLSI